MSNQFKDPDANSSLLHGHPESDLSAPLEKSTKLRTPQEILELLRPKVTPGFQPYRAPVAQMLPLHEMMRFHTREASQPRNPNINAGIEHRSSFFNVVLESHPSTGLGSPESIRPPQMSSSSHLRGNTFIMDNIDHASLPNGQASQRIPTERSMETFDGSNERVIGNPTRTFPVPPRAPQQQHLTFVPVYIHTAKCDKCEKRNDSVLQRCCTCNRQICKTCMYASGGDGIHVLDRDAPDWIVLGAQAGSKPRKDAKSHAKAALSTTKANDLSTSNVSKDKGKRKVGESVPMTPGNTPVKKRSANFNAAYGSANMGYGRMGNDDDGDMTDEEAYTPGKANQRFKTPPTQPQQRRSARLQSARQQYFDGSDTEDDETLEDEEVERKPGTSGPFDEDVNQEAEILMQMSRNAFAAAEASNHMERITNFIATERQRQPTQWSSEEEATGLSAREIESAEGLIHMSRSQTPYRFGYPLPHPGSPFRLFGGPNGPRPHGPFNPPNTFGWPRTESFSRFPLFETGIDPRTGRPFQ